MKLYWRVKIDGKWTYKAAVIEIPDNPDTNTVCVYLPEELKE